MHVELALFLIKVIIQKQSLQFWDASHSFILHDHRVIAKFLHECFAHRSKLLESV